MSAVTVFVATYEPYHDNSQIVGVRRTLPEAKALFPEVAPTRLWTDGTVRHPPSAGVIFAQYTTLPPGSYGDIAQVVEVEVP